MGWQQQRGSSTATKPSWLQAALSDLEQRFHSLSVYNQGGINDDGDADSFADRAENYYRKRPQLLALLQDLYSRYLSLADRYTQALLKTQTNNNCASSVVLGTPRGSHCRSQSQVSLVHSDLDDAETVITDLTADDVDAACRDYFIGCSSSDDNESTVSTFHTSRNSAASRKYKQPASYSAAAAPAFATIDGLVAELVWSSVESDILRDDLSLQDRRQSESSRKVDLQANLIGVLEEERVLLLGENARLAQQAKAAAEENEGLAAEVGFMRRRAGELARCVVRLREDHRVCVLGRKIEALQAQIYGLEKRNRECYEVMARREEEKAELVRGVCAELERVKAENKKLREAMASAGAGKVKKGDTGGEKGSTTATAPMGSFGWGRQVVRKMEEWVTCGGGAHMAKHDDE